MHFTWSSAIEGVSRDDFDPYVPSKRRASPDYVAIDLYEAQDAFLQACHLVETFAALVRPNTTLCFPARISAMANRNVC